MFIKIIKHIKNGTLIRTIRFNHFIKKYQKKNIFDKKQYIEELGKILLGYRMNLDNPITFNEKLNWYKLNYNNPLMSKVVDKVSAKAYVEEKGLSSILIKTIKVYNLLEEIALEELPDRFVIKNSLDSGGVLVCHNKQKITMQGIKDRLLGVRDKLFVNGHYWSLEPVYEGKNRILVEELLDTEDGHAPKDYKFFCFNGEPKALFVATNRETDVNVDFYDIDFNWLPFWRGHKNNKKNRPQKPINYEKMVEIARILSADFPFVRVDLYNVNGEIKFGELTFYPGAGFESFKPRKWDYEFGKMFDIDALK